MNDEHRFTLTDNKTGRSIYLSEVDCKLMLCLLQSESERRRCRVVRENAETEPSNIKQDAAGEPARPFVFFQRIKPILR